MEVGATNGTRVLIESVNDSSRLVVPQLDTAIVQRRSQQRQGWMEGNALDAVALALKLHQPTESVSLLPLSPLNKTAEDAHTLVSICIVGSVLLVVYVATRSVGERKRC